MLKPYTEYYYYHYNCIAIHEEHRMMATVMPRVVMLVLLPTRVREELLVLQEEATICLSFVENTF